MIVCYFVADTLAFIIQGHSVVPCLTKHSKPKAQIPSQFYSLKLCIPTTILYQVKVFLKVTNTHLYITKNETTQKIS
jgi:hypothetical protein